MDPESALAFAAANGASYAEARIETVEENRLGIEDGEVRSLVSGSETGFCVRVLVDGAWGFASSNDLGNTAWKEAVASALRLARTARRVGQEPVRLADAPAVKASEVWKPRQDPRNVSVEERLALLKEMDRRVRAYPEMKSATAAVSDATVRKRFLNTDGARIEWGLTRTIAQAHFTARRDGLLASRGARVGGTRGWEVFQGEDPVEKAVEAAASTVKALGAPAIKGGKMTVVIDHELAGVFAHEAVGHAAEGDLVASHESCFRDRLGERIGVPGLSIRDDSTVPGGFGSFPYDDNGVKGQSRPIVEDGVLAGYLLDRPHAAELGLAPNGSARAQDYASRPLVRMSNTLVAPGDRSDAEVFSGIRGGVFCKGSRGGQVDCARGTFLFNAQEAYRIEDGEVTTPIRDVSLTGGILETLWNIEALGKTARLGDPGHCGKGQWVPVCDGGPLVRIKGCLVGGGA